MASYSAWTLKVRRTSHIIFFSSNFGVLGILLTNWLGDLLYVRHTKMLIFGHFSVLLTSLWSCVYVTSSVFVIQSSNQSRGDQKKCLFSLSAFEECTAWLSWEKSVCECRIEIFQEIVTEKLNCQTEMRPTLASKDIARLLRTTTKHPQKVQVQFITLVSSSTS